MTTVNTKLLLDNVKAPRLPAAPVEYAQRYGDDLTNILRLYFNRLDNLFGALLTTEGGKFLNLPFGAFQDNTTQTIATINTAQAVTFNTTDLSNGVALGSPTSRIVITNPGRYNFQFSAQLDKASGSAANIWIWPKINGVNVPDSASKVAIQGTTAETVPAWNWVLEMNANDYFQLYWLTDDTNVQLKHDAGFGTAPNDVPAIPSVILTVTFVSSLAA